MGKRNPHRGRLPAALNAAEIHYALAIPGAEPVDGRIKALCHRDILRRKALRFQWDSVAEALLLEVIFMFGNSKTVAILMGCLEILDYRFDSLSSRGRQAADAEYAGNLNRNVARRLG